MQAMGSSITTTSNYSVRLRQTQTIVMNSFALQRKIHNSHGWKSSPSITYDTYVFACGALTEVPFFVCEVDGIREHVMLIIPAMKMRKTKN